MTTLTGNVYVINMDRTPERLALIDKNLRELGIHYTRVRAIDGQTLTDEEIQKKTSFLCRTMLCSKSMVGCALSHMKTWEMIASTKSGKWHLVIEDDVTITKRTIDFLNKLKKDVIDGLGDKVIINLACPFDFCKSPFKKEKEELLRTPFFSVFASAYLITTEMARALVDRYKKVYWHVDEMMAFSGIGEFYVTPYSIVEHNGLRPEMSHNLDRNMFMPLFDWNLKYMGWNKLRHIMASTVFSLNMKYSISVYHLVFGLLLLLNMFFLESFKTTG